MNKLKLCTFVHLLIVMICYGQPEPSMLWTHTYGGQGNDWPYAGVLRPFEEGFLLAGSQNLSTDSLCGLIIRVNAMGDTVWTHCLPGVGFYGSHQSEIASFILVGGAGSWSAGSSDAFAALFDENGDTVWTGTWGGSSNDRLVSCVEVSQGGFLFGGYSASFSADENLDYYIIRVDSDGDTLWTRSWGEQDNDAISKILVEADGGYSIVGWTRSFGSGQSDYCIQRIDSNGSILWTHTYGTDLNELARSGCKTSDGGCLVVGTTAPASGSQPTAFLVRTSQSGDSLWARTYGNNYQSSTSYDIMPISGGDFIMAGNYSANLEINAWLVRLNEEGDTVWTQAYGQSGPNHVESALSVAGTSDGGYVLGGTYWNLDGTNGTDFLLIRTGHDQETGIEDRYCAITEAFSISAYPNPFNAETRIQFVLARSVYVRIVISNILGQSIATLLDDMKTAGSHSVIWNGKRSDGENAASGLYVYQIRAGNFVDSKKMVLIR